MRACAPRRRTPSRGGGLPDSAGCGVLLLHSIDEMRHPVAFDDGRVAEKDGRTREVGEKRDAFAEDHRGELDSDLVEQTQVEALLSDVRPGNADPLAARHRLRL